MYSNVDFFPGLEPNLARERLNVHLGDSQMSSLSDIIREFKQKNPI